MEVSLACTAPHQRCSPGARSSLASAFNKSLLECKPLGELPRMSLRLLCSRKADRLHDSALQHDSRMSRPSSAAAGLGRQRQTAVPTLAV